MIYVHVVHLDSVDLAVSGGVVGGCGLVSCDGESSRGGCGVSRGSSSSSLKSVT